MKNVLILMLTLLISTTYSFSQVNLKNGLVACYPFNGNSKDESGNNNNGTVNGATLTTDRFGKINSAYNFDGNSFIQLANPNDFKNNTFTYSAWVYIPVEPSSDSYLNAYSVLSIGNGQVMHFVNRPTEGLVWGFTTYNEENISYDINPSSTSKTTLNTWHHFVISRSTTQAKIYIDGELIVTATSSLPTTATYTSNNPSVVYQATIGTRPDANNIQFFNGNIDDIHLYNRAINADEIKALYDGNTPQTITITSNNSAPCGGDKITFTANGATNTSKYQWKVDGVNQGTNSSTFDYTSVKKTGDYSVKISVEVINEDICFPQKPVTPEQTITIKDCASTGVNLKNGLVACYPFNGNSNDESGNNNNGTVNGATLTTDRFGKANGAYNFDGSSLISIDPAHFQNQSYTYATWVKLDNLPSENDNNCFITIGGAGGDQVLSVTSNYTASASNGFNVGGYNNGNPIQSNNWNNVTPTTGKWYHVVCTRDNNSIKLYVDGQLIAKNSTLTSTGGTTPNYGSPTYVTFGARNGGASQYMQGSLDDIHLYNRAINADEVKALYDGSSPQIVTISPNNPDPCGGEKISFTANGATNTSKYQWKVDGINIGSPTSSNIFNFDLPTLSSSYQLRFSVEITDDNDVCFPNKISFAEYNIIIGNCTPCIIACHPFNVVKTK
jgi:hypothetical protein